MAIPPFRSASTAHSADVVLPGVRGKGTYRAALSVEGISWESFSLRVPLGPRVVLRGAKLSKMGTLIVRQSFPVPAGTISRNLLPTISIWIVYSGSKFQKNIHQNLLHDGLSSPVFFRLIWAKCI